MEGFRKVNDKMIEKVFTKEGDTVADARKRLYESARRGIETYRKEAEEKN